MPRTVIYFDSQRYLVDVLFRIAELQAKTEDLRNSYQGVDGIQRSIVCVRKENAESYPSVREKSNEFDEGNSKLISRTFNK